MHSLIACEVLPENPWVKEKMLAKTRGVRPGLRSDNGAAHRRSRLAGIRLAQPVPALPGHALTGSSTGRRHLSAAGRLISLLAFEVAVLTEDGPGNSGELVG